MGAGKRKGTCHPSNPSPLPSPPPARSSKNPESVLKLLPVTILALALSLPTQDREVLTYLLARSVLNPTSTHHQQHINKCKKKTSSSSGNGGPLFECGCFECYTSFWYRWDSSPNRELIHQVIEGFEEHLSACETTRKKTNPNPNPNLSKGKRAGLRNLEKEVVLVPDHVEVKVEMEMEEEEEEDGSGGDVAADVGSGGRSNHKCLARKVLPDVVGLFNSRFWSLWSPGV